LRNPGDTVFAVVSLKWAKSAIRRFVPDLVRYVRLERFRGGVRIVRLAEPKNLTRRLVDLAVGEELTLAVRHWQTLASLATRVRHAHPNRRYRTHRDRRAGTFSVAREA
jgi:hypothetical protein